MDYEDCVCVNITFGVRSGNASPEDISAALGLEPSRAFAKGDEFESCSGIHERPWGVWQLRSDDHVHNPPTP